MRIRLLGTGAADGIPSMYGDDRVSRHAQEHGGKDIRSRSAAIVDDVLKIDLPQDTLMQLQRDRIGARDWTGLFFTHSDDDHFAVSEIQYALMPFTDLDHLPYPVYANEVVCGLIRERYPQWPIELVEMHSFKCCRHGPYRITPVRANHIDGEDCLNLIFQRDGKSILYATDTGVWKEETWAFLSRIRLDGLVLECTDGFDPTNYEGHLDVKECISVVARLREMGVLHDDSQVATTHHSVRGMATHAELDAAFRPHGIVPGWDGFEMEV